MFDPAPPSDLNDELTVFRSSEGHVRDLADKDLQRAKGCGRIVLSASTRGTRIMDVFQQSPIRIMFPGTVSGAVKEAVLVNTAGGIAGGDWLETSVTTLPGASIAVTSQAAEKVYRAPTRPSILIDGLLLDIAWTFQRERLCASSPGLRVRFP